MGSTRQYYAAEFISTIGGLYISSNLLNKGKRAGIALAAFMVAYLPR
jgi:hypothetical protein